MSRPKSDDKRNSILAAATHVIASQGLSAPTAMIAREAGVANGTLFTYFETKASLLNQLYLELKAQMASETLKGIFDEREPREQLFRSWENWMRWSTAYPETRRVLAQLMISEEITLETRATAGQDMARLGVLFEQIRKNGPMANAPAEFAGQIMEALGNATVDYILADPTNAEAHCKMGFEALWRAVGSP